jgi:hypothetical protein
MKTQIVFKVAVALLLSLSVGSSFGQLITRADTLPTVYIYGNSFVNRKVQHAFTKRFKDAVNPRWYAMDQNFLVKFRRIKKIMFYITRKGPSFTILLTEVSRLCPNPHWLISKLNTRLIA